MPARISSVLMFFLNRIPTTFALRNNKRSLFYSFSGGQLRLKRPENIWHTDWCGSRQDWALVRNITIEFIKPLADIFLQNSSDQHLHHEYIQKSYVILFFYTSWDLSFVGCYIVSLGVALIQLTGAANLIWLSNHFMPVRYPAGCSTQSKNYGKHTGWNAKGF